MPDSISITNGFLVGCLRLVRRRLDELSSGGVVWPEDLQLLMAYLDKVDEEWQDVERALGIGGSSSGHDQTDSW